MNGLQLLEIIGVGIALVTWVAALFKCVTDGLERIAAAKELGSSQAHANWAMQASLIWERDHPSWAEVAMYLSAPDGKTASEFAEELATRYPDTPDGRAAAVREARLSADRMEGRLQSMARFLREVSIEASQIRDADMPTTRLLSRLIAVEQLWSEDEENRGSRTTRKEVLQD